MLSQCRRKLAVIWNRIQETPLELTFAWFLAVAAVMNLISPQQPRTFTNMLLLATIAVAGLFTTVGRLVANLDGESSGLALFVGALMWLLLYNFFTQPINGTAIANLLIGTGAYVVGFAIRLYVVRKAARVLRHAQRSGMRRQ